MKIPNIPTLLLAALLLGGCASNTAIRQIEASPDWTRKEVTAPLPAAAWIRGRSDVVHVYIEGDGVAYATPTSPSLDPTPITPTALLLAQQDTAQAVAYMARPCQYVSGSACSTQCWTTGRFSKQVLNAENRLLERIKKQAGADRIVLIGFSGGGAVAALLAAMRTDVAYLITVCGNLNPEMWTRLHHVTPLYDSLSPMDFAPQLANIPQTHFIGGEDMNMPRQVADSFLRQLGPGTKAEVRVVQDLGHGGAKWAINWNSRIIKVGILK